MGNANAAAAAAAGAETTARILQLEGAREQLDARIVDLESDVARHIAAVADRDARIVHLEQELAPRETLIAERDARIVELEADLIAASVRVAELELGLSAHAGGQTPPGVLIDDATAIASGFITISDGNTPHALIAPIAVSAWQFGDGGGGKLTFLEPINLSGVGLESPLLIGAVEIRDVDGEVVRRCVMAGVLMLQPGGKICMPAKSLIF